MSLFTVNHLLSRSDMVRWISSILMVTAPLLSFAGGGWTQLQGEGYFKLGHSGIRASEYFSRSSESVSIITTSIMTTSLYGEYGFRDRLTVMGYVPFVSTHVNGLASELTGNLLMDEDQFGALGDLEFAFKYGLITGKPFVLAASLWLGIPTGQQGGGNSGLLQTGDGEFNQMLRIDGSGGWKQFYYSGYTGLNNRTR